MNAAAAPNGRRRRIPSTCSLAERLTCREIQVLEAYIRTESYVAAAADLGLSSNTIRGHLANARTKTGVATTAKLVWVAARRLPRY